MLKKSSILNSRIILSIVFVITVSLLFSFPPESAEMKRDVEVGNQVISPLKRLAFRSVFISPPSSFNASLITFNADGTEEQVIANFNPGDYREPAWSPDGTQIIYIIQDNIFLTDLTNEENNGPLANTEATERNPSWSITGKIVYERDNEIWTMNGDGTDQTLFSGITQSVPKAPKWSPDGSKLAFTSGDEIWVINADGTNERRVTNNSTDDKEPDWSPDGMKLIYQKGSTGIAVINLDGTDETNLTDGIDDRTPAWSGDGVNIAFIRRGSQRNGLYIMDSTGANQIRIAVDDYVPGGPFSGNRGTQLDDPAWKPLDLQPNTFTISGRITEDDASLSGATVNLSGSATAQTTTDAIGNYQFSNLPSGGNYTVKPLDSNLIFTPRNKRFNNVNNNQIADFTSILRCAEPTCIANGKIVFVGISLPFTSNSESIYTMNPDASNLNRLIGPVVRRPRYSSDGSQIVYDKFFGAINYDIFKTDADGTSSVRLTNGGFSGGMSINNIAAAFSPDGQSIVFQSNRDGNNEIYKMNADGTNQVRLTNNPADDSSPSYSPDGTKIIFTRGSSSQENLYVMNSDGTNQTALPTPAGSYISPSYSPDGTKIIVSYSTQTNHFIHTMNSDGTNFVGTSIGANDPSYSPDGRKVIYSINSSINIVDADFIGSPVVLPNNFNHFEVDWQPIIIENNVSPSPAPFDFDGDRKSDVGVFRPSENKWYVSQSSDSQVTQKVFALGGDIPTPADFDGDGKTDLAIFRPSTGSWWFLSSIDNTQKSTQFGASGDIPLPSDVDGDDTDDYVLFRPSNNTWYRSTSNSANVSEVVFGASGDKPVIGDFDGDGESDPAIYRPSTGQWWYRSSVDNSQRATQWGISSDVPVPADYDGDGITDLAVYRPSNGGWYILNSSTGQATILGFGISNDIPVAADYDGDGKADIAVFRPSEGIWYLQQSMDGFAGLQFGVETDKPIPASFIQ